MPGRAARLITFFTRADPRGARPSGWALAFDAAIAVCAAAGAVYELVSRAITAFSVQGGVLHLPVGGGYVLLPARHALLSGPVAAHAPAVAVLAAAMTALPLALRRLYPVGVWLAVAAAIVTVHAWYVPPVALGTAVFAAYSAITYSRYRNLAFAMVAVVTLAVAATLGNELPRFPGRLTAVFAIMPAAVAGLGIRQLRRRLADSAARLSRAAEDARAATEQALAAERSRIAAELHDVVSHNVSVMVVQAGAARKIMGSSPADAEDALLAVEATGREAMTELRNLLGLLSPAASGTGDDARGEAAAAAAAAGRALSPQPRLADLDALSARVSAAGLPVQLSVTGTPWPLPPGADLAAFRVVQEGLTNVLRHAGTTAAPGTGTDAVTATVTVEWADDLVITVSDNGRVPAADDDGGTGPGRGLLGLRERVGLYGGHLAAGPLHGGGWQVRAVLPAGRRPA